MSTARRGAAVLGSPIDHSLSPVLHNTAYDALGLTEWRYRAIECAEADLEQTLRALDAEGLAGVSLTMPLKRAVMPLLASASRWTSAVQAANTVLFADAGRWTGANTDVPGLASVLRASDLAPSTDGTPWVIGAGATAGSALAALAALGYTAATVVARRPDAALSLLPIAEQIDIALDIRPWEDLHGAVVAPVVISTTPVGATDEFATVLPAVDGLLFDVIYAPWPTRLAAAWAAAGGAVVGGLELLVEQAAEQVQLMTGRTAPVEEMRRAGYAALRTA